MCVLFKRERRRKSQNGRKETTRAHARSNPPSALLSFFLFCFSVPPPLSPAYQINCSKTTASLLLFLVLFIALIFLFLAASVMGTIENIQDRLMECSVRPAAYSAS